MEGRSPQPQLAIIKADLASFLLQHPPPSQSSLEQSHCCTSECELVKLQQLVRAWSYWWRSEPCWHKWEMEKGTSHGADMLDVALAGETCVLSCAVGCMCAILEHIRRLRHFLSWPACCERTRLLLLGGSISIPAAG
ncbi:hypothetical protein CONLIGDRAFT_163089 [Coniochaeta ligniaria NRRL 30616]|uniref:Uncharacterized protein n=1 Tax=Coniochaeta ligniaria NRRL 30616 TaxID=1408157 RepID=A0A1J7JSZ6_9PEZI|nr:hypothetical protein CONLIGDRAFT_163089 [Coniochaeta ligniaria NRRL 30616]